MVNIALQLSGRLRYTEESISSLKASIVETLKPDIFCSFWEPNSPQTLNNLIEYLSPVAVEIEDQTLVRPYLDELFKFNVHANMPSMSYKFYKVSQLRQTYTRQTNKHYDVVIQARADNIFFELLDIERCRASLEQQAILCANQDTNPIIDDYIIGKKMVDNFYLGPEHLVNQAANTFWYLRSQAAEWTEKNWLHEVRIPEIIQTKIWQNLGITIGSLQGSGHVGNFWYDIDRRETLWK